MLTNTYAHRSLTALWECTRVEPVSLSDQKAWLRVDSTYDDALITDLIVAARYAVEAICKKTFIYQTWQLRLDHFDNLWQTMGYHHFPINWEWQLMGFYRFHSVTRIPYPPLVSVSSIHYIDTTGATQLLDPSQYIVSPGTPGRITPAYGITYPATRIEVDAVTIQFVCGMGDGADDIPNNITMAIKMYAAYLYENRGSEGDKNDLPTVVARLLQRENWGSYR